MPNRASRGMLVIAVAFVAIAVASLIYLNPHKSSANAARPTPSTSPRALAVASPTDLSCPPTELKLTGVFEECASVGQGQTCSTSPASPLWVVLMHGSKHDFLLYVEGNSAYKGPGNYLLTTAQPEGSVTVEIREYISGRLWVSSAGSVDIIDLGSGGGWGGWIYAGLGPTKNSPVQTALNLAGWWSCS